MPASGWAARTSHLPGCLECIGLACPSVCLVGAGLADQGGQCSAGSMGAGSRQGLSSLVAGAELMASMGNVSPARGLALQGRLIAPALRGMFCGWWGQGWKIWLHQRLGRARKSCELLLHFSLCQERGILSSGVGWGCPAQDRLWGVATRHQAAYFSHFPRAESRCIVTPPPRPQFPLAPAPSGVHSVPCTAPRTSPGRCLY